MIHGEDGERRKREREKHIKRQEKKTGVENEEMKKDNKEKKTLE